MLQFLLAERLSPQAEQRLEAAGRVIRPPNGDEDTLCELIRDVDALIARTHTRVNRRLLSAGTRLKAVGVAGVGLDKVDQQAAAELGVAILNRPGAATSSVAELTLGLILNLLRPIPRLAGAYARGEFKQARAKPHGPELRGLTVGVVGMGRIGAAVGRACAAGFGARVLYNDIIDVGPFDFDATATDKATIWSQCDVVTLHTPLTDDTRRLVSADVLAQMKPTAYLINAARGAIVDTDALTDALIGGRIAGAGLDVTDPEPLPPEHRLFHCETCVMTPHVAARTFEGLERMYGIVDDVIEFLNQK